MLKECLSQIADVATTLYTLVAICQVWVTWKIAKSIEVSSRINRQIDMSKHLNEQWQEFNMSILKDAELRKAWLDLGIEKYNDHDEDKYNTILFYIVNILYDGFCARENDQIVGAFYNTMLDDHVRLLFPVRQRLESLLDGKRGYRSDFIKEIKEKLEKIESEVTKQKKEHEKIAEIQES